MSGIGMGAASGSGAPPVQPLSVYCWFNGDDVQTVSGASGQLVPTGGGSTPYKPNLIVVNVTGGVAPYSYNVYLSSNPSGKIGVVQVGGYWTLTWAGFILNEGETCVVQADVTDSVGTIRGDDKDGVIGIYRTS